MSDLLDLARTIVGWAGPNEQLEAYVSWSRTTSVRAYQGEVESFSSAEPAGVGIRIIVEGRQGFASAGTLDEAVLKETLAEARDNVAFAAADEFVALAEPDRVDAPALTLCREDVLSIPTAAKVELAIELERLALAADPRVKGVRIASYSDGVGEQAVASTTGIAVSWRASHASSAVQAMAEQGGDTQIAAGRSIGRHPEDLDLEATAAEAAERAIRLLGASKPASRRVTAVLDPEVSAAFLSIIGGTLSGEAVLKGRSLFANRVGEDVAVPAVTLVDDPTDAAAPGAERYDGEGLGRRRNALIDNGTLKGFLYNTYAARRAGTASTASAARGYGSTPGIAAPALRLAPGPKGAGQLLAELGDAVYVQDVSGLHSGVNPVSGDFSVGATGLMVRGGALAEPFREATIASTLQRMLLEVTAVGDDLRWFGPGAAGVTLVVADVSLGGS